MLINLEPCSFTNSKCHHNSPNPRVLTCKRSHPTNICGKHEALPGPAAPCMRSRYHPNQPPHPHFPQVYSCRVLRNTVVLYVQCRYENPPPEIKQVYAMLHPKKRDLPTNRDRDLFLV